jgi:DeoR/GlpR family transcriptional regulator of sugar metabolism
VRKYVAFFEENVDNVRKCVIICGYTMGNVEISLIGRAIMLPQERLNRIKDLLSSNGSIVISNLSGQFDVSEETIRRDLEKLSKTMKFKRVRGGAFLYEPTDTEVPVGIREKIYIKEKQIIANRSVGFIEDGDTIMLDSSTTALHIAKSINESQKKVTVITNSISIANELAENMGVKIISLGGRLRRSTKSYVGYMATDYLSQVHANKAFVSCTSVNLDFGVSDSHTEEARVRKEMLRNSSKRFLIADYTKFEEPSMNKICDFKDLDYLIVDRKISKEAIDRLEEYGVKTIWCD